MWNFCILLTHKLESVFIAIQVRTFVAFEASVNIKKQQTRVQTWISVALTSLNQGGRRGINQPATQQRTWFLVDSARLVSKNDTILTKRPDCCSFYFASPLSDTLLNHISETRRVICCRKTQVYLQRQHCQKLSLYGCTHVSKSLVYPLIWKQELFKTASFFSALTLHFISVFALTLIWNVDEIIPHTHTLYTALEMN